MVALCAILTVRMNTMMCLQKVSEQHQILVNHYNICPECMLPQNFKESTIFSINCLLTL